MALTIGELVSLVAAFAAGLLGASSYFHLQLNRVRDHGASEIAKVRDHSASEIAKVRDHAATEIARVRDDCHSRINEVRDQYMRRDDFTLQFEHMSDRMSELSTEMKALGARIDANLTSLVATIQGRLK